MALLIGLCVAGYLIGSINFAIVVTKLFIGDDIRNYGSGNAGMTNVLRTAGKKAAALVTVGDTLKGVLPVLAARLLFNESTFIRPITAAYIVAFCTVLGHLLPVYYGFRGGKGLLTAAGAMAVVDPIAVGILLVVFLILVIVSRIMSVGSVSVGILFPITTYCVQRFILHNTVSWSNILFSIGIGGILVYMHKGNIQRILSGTERKIGEKAEKKVEEK